MIVWVFVETPREKTNERHKQRFLKILGFSFVATMAITWASTLVRADSDDPAIDPARPEYGYWSYGKPRWFVSSKSELGIIYAKPYLSSGYGLPHWIWTGVDINAITTVEMAQTYAGVRVASPIVDLAFGLRDTWSYNKPFLLPAESFDSASVLDAPGDKARYWAWEAEAVAIAPLPYSALVADFIIVRTLDVPRDHFVFDESYRAVVKNDLFYNLRVAAISRFLKEYSLRVGALSEYVFGTGRNKGVVRLGPVASLVLTDHIEINAALTLAVSSPDQLGLVLGAYGVAGIRYRWATSESKPQLPWEGTIIP